MSVKTGEEIVIRVEPRGDPQVARIAAMLQERIARRCAARLVERPGAPRIILELDGGLPAEAFRIDQPGSAVRVAGGSPRGLLYGIGKFLRTCRYDEPFQPSSWRGTSAPRGALRGMYLANHFHNWYQMAGREELESYIEDLALWGVNSLMTSFPLIHLSGWDDPEAGPAMAQTRKLFQAARNAGLSVTAGAGNILFTSAPAEVRAMPLPDPLGRHGNSGTAVCPSLEAGRELILNTMAAVLENLKDIGVDYLCIWPYDEGGCACERCRPWGANGFVRMSRDIARVARAIFPGLKIILSTWTFDTPPEGEWQGLADALAKDGGWADVILADAHEDFPRYPLDVGVPGGLPLINFPEISMWGNWPWGGAGAHPLPARMQRLWEQAGHALQGGFPYSEGIYEDLNKAIAAQFYWDPSRSAEATLREYAGYEFSPAAAEDVAAMAGILEAAAGNAYTKRPVDAGAAERAWRLAQEVDARLPGWARQGWRWEILRLRALIDRERFAGDGLESPAAQAALLRLSEIYHCQVETDDPYHHRVRPLLRQAVSRGGQC